ncbi:hypothetical protein MKW98_022583, partial [Papaver atlanticum]
VRLDTMPSFDFTLQGDHEDTKTFEKFIDRLLFLRQPSLKIVKFALTSDRVFAASKIHDWISKIVKCNIEELSLKLHRHCIVPFPLSFFNCESLVKLRLHMNLWLPESISWPRLNLLQLSYGFSLDKLYIEQLILRSPLLETLILSECSWSNWNGTTLNISAPALKCLVFNDLITYTRMRNRTVKIHAPELMHFTYTGDFATDFTMSSFSSLEDAEIRFKIKSYYLDEAKRAQIGHAAIKLVGGLSNE